MSLFWITFGVAGWVTAVLVFSVLNARTRRKTLAQAFRLRTHIRPYLSRRAQEASLSVPDAPAPTVDAIVDDLCELTAQLTQHERGDAGDADTVNMIAVSDTQPLITDD